MNCSKPPDGYLSQIKVLSMVFKTISDHIFVPLLRHLSLNLISDYSAPGHFIPEAMGYLCFLNTPGLLQPQDF